MTNRSSVNSDTVKPQDKPRRVVTRRTSSLRNLARKYGTLAIMILICIVFQAIEPTFLSPGNVLNILKQGSILACVGMGMTLVFTVGGIDMSIGAVTGVAANLAAGMMAAGASMPLGILAGLGSGFSAGCIAAVLIVLAKIPPFIATFGMMYLANGVEFAYNRGLPILLFGKPSFLFMGQGSFCGLPVLALLMLVVVGIMYVFTEQAAVGSHLYSVAGNVRAAVAAGINVPRTIAQAYMINGLLCGLAGVMQASLLSGTTPLEIGMPFLRDAFVGIFLGSTMFKEGEINMPGSLVGAMFVHALGNGLLLANVSHLVVDAVKGGILIGALVLQSTQKKREIGQVALYG